MAKSLFPVEEVTISLYDKVVKNLFVKESEDDSIEIDSNAILDEKIREHEERKQREKEIKKKALIQSYIEQVTLDEEGNAIYPKDEDGNILIPSDSDGNPLFSLNEDGIPILPTDGNDLEDGFSEGIDPDSSQEEETDFSNLSEEAHAEADKIIQRANMEAERIISDAESRGEALKLQMSEEGKSEGYSEGLNRAVSEYKEKEEALEEEKISLEKDYREKQKNIEKETVDMVTDIVSKFFKIEFGDKKELLNHIIDNALLNIEDSKNFEIHVSREQFPGVSKRRDEFQKITGESATVDVVADPLLKEGECLIETDSGVYDCSLDTELDSLIRDLKALSIQE